MLASVHAAIGCLRRKWEFVQFDKENGWGEGDAPDVHGKLNGRFASAPGRQNWLQGWKAKRFMTK
jgi:hypothetical protein